MGYFYPWCVGGILQAQDRQLWGGLKSSDRLYQIAGMFDKKYWVVNVGEMECYSEYHKLFSKFF